MLIASDGASHWSSRGETPDWPAWRRAIAAKCDDEYRRSVHGSVPLASRVSTRCGCELATRSCETRTSSWRECVATESLDRRNRPGTGTTSTGHEHTNTLQPLYSTSMAKHETAQQDQTKLERATILVSRHLSIEYGHNQRASMPTYLYPYRMFP